MIQGKKQKEINKFIYEEKVHAFSIIKTHLKAPKLHKVCNKVFRQWDWISNISQCSGGCRITVGWNSDEVQVMTIHSTRQMILCLIENNQSHEKMYCSFVYTDNKGMEKRNLWKDLQLAKCVTNGYLCIQIGDFNVTLKLEEHTTRKSTISNDMQEFIECTNKIEVDDVCMTGMFYTWSKSPSNPSTSILKKLNRVMENKEFITKHNHTNVVFHPFLVSDHCPTILVIPQAMMKKRKSFKFANFVVDKSEFLPLVERIWNEEIHGIHMFNITKRMKLLKSGMKKLQWKNGYVFYRVESLRSKLKND
ncbi:RNA-directed DNA polymerase, eukaryota, reverse transcriptase zinc-binding domain protein [Tanacetum coccineum]